MKKVVNLSEVKFSKMNNDELLTYTIDQLSKQVVQLVLITTQLSQRIDNIEKKIN
jgi:hypothetical protein